MSSNNSVTDDALTDALSMLAAFTRAGATTFDVTTKLLSGEKKGFRRRVATRSLIRDLTRLMEAAEAETLNIIIRPHSRDISFIQLDDIQEEALEALTPHSCCSIQTSEGSYQAFIAVSGLDKKSREKIRQQLVEIAKADAGASGAARLAGSFNVKERHRKADGSFPRVRILSPGNGRIFSVPELIASGLIRSVVAKVPESSCKTIAKRPRRTIVPNYERTKLYVRPKEDGTTDRSAVDLLYAITCLDWQISREKTAKLLHEYSEKAAERGEDYVERTVVKAQEKILQRQPKKLRGRGGR
jgi:hypothetical protein